MEWHAWVVLVLSLGFLAVYGREVWRSAGQVQPDPSRPYTVYCRDFDIEVEADKLDETLGRTPRANIAKREDIQKDLQAWRVHYDSAAADAAARIRATTSSQALEDTVVSFLVDHSGSMRGLVMPFAAKAVMTASDLLEHLGAKQEVLGFTTVRWKGGLSRQKWIEAGSPLYPGRLNDVLHTVYCSAGQRPKEHHYAAMMREELLKENLDGEAVAWAAARLRTCAETRKHLIVLSDGAPVDDSTLAANGGTFLVNHLQDVIQEIALAGDIQLAAVGLGYDASRYYDVNRYYARSITLKRADDDLGLALLQLLERLLCAEPPSPGGEKP